MSERDLPGGEPPASPTEERLARFLDEALDKLQRGETVYEEVLLADRPDLIERGRALFARLRAFGEAAPNAQPGAAVPPTRPLSSAPAAAGVGVTLPDPLPGAFQVLGLLGEGAFGEVWLAHDVNLGRKVALKTLHFRRGAEPDPVALEALRKEAQLLAAVTHPHVVTVHFWLPTAGQEYYLVLRYVEGGSLGDRLRREGPLDWRQVERYAADVGEGLLAVHAAGVLHRDIKPDNILWNRRDDEAVLTDFGVSARLSDARSVAGTPLFMAPEAMQGRPTEASDVYGLAATLFCLVTGQPPFPAESLEELERLAVQGLPESDDRFRTVPEPLEQVLRAGLAAKAAHRPPLRQFVDMLRGAFNQALADALASPAGAEQRAAPVDLRLVVSRRDESNTWRPAATTHPPAGGTQRDLKKVPRQPGRVRLRTGEPIRVEVLADKDGYVTVFNVGPTGNLNLLYPDEWPVAGAPPDIRAGRPLHVLDTELVEPAGRERLFAVWSREPLPLRTAEMQSLAEKGQLPGTRPYRASRDIVRVQDAVRQAGPGDCCAVVVELDHGA